VTVNRDSNSSQKPLHFDEASAATTTKKNVSFNLDLNEQYANKQLFKDQCYDLWFSSEEMKSSRIYTAKISQTMITSTKPCHVLYAKGMSVVYRTCCKADEQTEQALIHNDSKYLIKCLNKNLLGMDKWGIEAMAIHCSECRVVLTTNCTDLQDKHWEHAHFDEMLCTKSESISRASHLYVTTILGLALAQDIKSNQGRSFTDTVKELYCYL
jgi:hypothetical protein